MLKEIQPQVFNLELSPPIILSNVSVPFNTEKPACIVTTSFNL